MEKVYVVHINNKWGKSDVITRMGFHEKEKAIKVFEEKRAEIKSKRHKKSDEEENENMFMILDSEHTNFISVCFYELEVE